MLGSIVQPLHSKEKQQVLKAINELGFAVTPEKISLSTNLPLAAATQQLNLVATETSAHLAVDSAGALHYQFAPGFENAYVFDITKQLFRTNGNFAFRLMRVTMRIAAATFLYVANLLIALLQIAFKLAFGVILIASLIAICVAIVAAVFGAIASLFGGGDGDGGDMGGGIDFSWVGDTTSGVSDFFSSGSTWDFDLGHSTFDLLNLISWNYCWHDHPDSSVGYSYAFLPQGPAPSQNTASISYDAGQPYAQYGQIEKPRVSFMANCFSFLFGDGDPNADLKDRYWAQIGLVIKRNYGVVVAEQLAPYAGDDSNSEDWMLPILVHFNGTPEVTENGNILYVFPSFTSEVSSPTPSSAINTSGSDPLRDLYRVHLNRQKNLPKADSQRAQNTLAKYLEERHWQFTLQDGGASLVVGTLVMLNFIGSYWFYTTSMTTKMLVPFHGLSIFMLIYAAFFLIVPAVRFGVINCLNIGIFQRNAMRAQHANALNTPDHKLKTRLSEASTLANELGLRESATIVYSTETDIIEQEFTRPKLNLSRSRR
ncbi:MAG: hypothetical protein IAF58_15240 [Leptolyngbya sp.]|nr:hypothetical protein [Candidatus Melainabacteria bacterium]